MNRCPKCGMGYGQHATYCTDCGDNLVRETALPGHSLVRSSKLVGAPTMTPERRAALWTRILQLCQEYNVGPRDVQMVLEAERRTQSDGAPTEPSSATAKEARPNGD